LGHEGRVPVILLRELQDARPARAKDRGMGPGATATGHADGARQWFAGCPAVHQKEPGEQS